MEYYLTHNALQNPPAPGAGDTESFMMILDLTEAKPNVSGQIAQSSSSTIEISHIFALLQYAYGTNPIVQKLRFLNYSCMKIGLSSYLWKLQMSIVIRYLI